MHTMWIDEAQDFEISKARHASPAPASIPDSMPRMLETRSHRLSERSEDPTCRRESRSGKAAGAEPPGKINGAADISSAAGREFRFIAVLERWA
jgi:hypothetical protein